MKTCVKSELSRNFDVALLREFVPLCPNEQNQFESESMADDKIANIVPWLSGEILIIICSVGPDDIQLIPTRYSRTQSSNLQCNTT